MFLTDAIARVPSSYLQVLQGGHSVFSRNLFSSPPGLGSRSDDPKSYQEADYCKGKSRIDETSSNLNTALIYLINMQSSMSMSFVQTPLVSVQTPHCLRTCVALLLGFLWKFDRKLYKFSSVLHTPVLSNFREAQLTEIRHGTEKLLNRTL